ncbi:MAG: FHIPEP family type III secretion protein [Bryobacteraceae bacterium]
MALVNFGPNEDELLFQLVDGETLYDTAKRAPDDVVKIAPQAMELLHVLLTRAHLKQGKLTPEEWKDHWRKLRGIAAGGNELTRIAHDINKKLGPGGKPKAIVRGRFRWPFKFQDEEGGSALGDQKRKPSPDRTASLAPSRAPVVIAIEKTGAEIDDQELLPAERHLRVTLSEAAVNALCSIQARLAQPASLDEIFALGSEAWETLVSASSQLRELLLQVAAAEAKEHFPQPVAWTGRLDLLGSIYQAILIAADNTGDTHSFVTVAGGAHYFHPLPSSQSPRSMQRRAGGRQGKVNVGSIGWTAGNVGGLRAMSRALENEVVMVCADDSAGNLQQIIGLLAGQPSSSPTRVIAAFGSPALEASTIDAAIAVIPCLSFAGPALREAKLLREIERSFSLSLKTQAVPVVVNRLRGDLLKAQLSNPRNTADLGVVRDALTWSTWSWIGRPLFSDEFGEVRKAAYPHLMDLRDVASRDWYFERSADIPEIYRTSALTERESKPMFHLYLSGAGGTGKSCFLRFIYETLLTDNRKVLPVWYKVHAPSSDWTKVQAQIKKEVRAALEKRLGSDCPNVISETDDQKQLKYFLLDLLTRLRARTEGIDQIVLFIDQLERTFESGENPEPDLLREMSEKIVELLQCIGIDNGVRLYIASRKQYLADFLSSFEKANKISLHFNVLQTLPKDRERTRFVDGIVRWCDANNLIPLGLRIDGEAAELLAEHEQGHPLNMMLSLIQILSRSDLPREISRSTIQDFRPWQQRFYVDEALMGKDDLDWYLFLAMAHARTEIVRREEVLWRLGLVSRELAGRIKELTPHGVLERLWLLGHLGRTMHPRPEPHDSARYLEFFHANLRDHLVANVMNRVEEPAGPGASRPRQQRRGMPPAWRALDRLREIARGWDHVQQPLMREDIAVLMEHKDQFTERTPINGRPVNVESFYFLFMRDAEDRRENHFRAAKECVAYSAIVHDVLGRWAFRTLFPSIAAAPVLNNGYDSGSGQQRAGNGGFDDSQVGCCRRWLIPGRADNQSRFRILHYLVELRDVQANHLLAELVFDRAADEEPWQQLAGILAEPLVAATHRGAFLAYVVQFLLNRRVSLTENNWDVNRLGAFLVAACGGEKHEVSRLFESLSAEVTLVGDPRLQPALRDLAEPNRVGRWLGDSPTVPSPSASRERRPEAAIELRIGESLALHLDAHTLEQYIEAATARISVPLPRPRLSHSEVSEHRRTKDLKLKFPPGYEVQLLVQGRLVGLGRFFPGRVQTLTRDWKDDEAEGAIHCFNEALWEPVRWVEEKTLDEKKWRWRRWTLEQSLTAWLEGLLRQSIEAIFGYEEAFLYLNRVAESAGLDIVIQSLSNVLYQVRTLITHFVRERVPMAERNVDLVVRLIDILRESDTVDPFNMTLRLREHLKDDLCRALAGDSNQLFVLLLDLVDEMWLIGKLTKTTLRMRLEKLTPEEELRMMAAIRERFEEVARAEHESPILVCLDYLRAPLFEMLQRFDPRILVLSYTELSLTVRVTSRGVVRRFSPAGGKL